MRKDNLVSASVLNVVARIWEAGIGLAVVPIILRQLGGESYGLIAFTQSLFAIVGLLDLGLSAAATRELAKGEVDSAGQRVISAIVRTLEYPLLGMAALIVVSSVLGSQWVATHFLKVEKLPVGEVAAALQLFAFSFIFRWLSGFYRAVFYGLERQVLFNLVAICYITLRYFGAVALLSQGVIGVLGLFLWYTALDGLYFVGLRLKVRQIERAGSRINPGFSMVRLQSVLSYALGTMGLAVVGVLVMQADKVLIAKVRPLQELGAYTLAFTLAMGIRIIPGALWAAAFPRLVTKLQGARAGQTMAFLQVVFTTTSTAAFCVAVPLAWFSGDVIAVLAGEAIDASLASAVLALLAIGAVVESLNAPCYQQLLAAGHARALLRTTFCVNLCYLAAIMISLGRFGIIGVAALWPVLQLFLFWFYARQVKTLGGANFAGAMQAILMRVLAILSVFLFVRIAVTGMTSLVACIAAVASGAILLAGFSIWDARRFYEA